MKITSFIVLFQRYPKNLATEQALSNNCWNIIQTKLFFSILIARYKFCTGLQETIRSHYRIRTGKWIFIALCILLILYLYISLYKEIYFLNNILLWVKQCFLTIFHQVIHNLYRMHGFSISSKILNKDVNVYKNHKYYLQ